MVWAKHSGDSKWHVIDEPADGAVPTRCHGRWPVDDVVEYADSPPHDDRCDFCQRTVVDSIEHGFAELREFDFGGES